MKKTFFSLLTYFVIFFNSLLGLGMMIWAVIAEEHSVSIPLNDALGIAWGAFSAIVLYMSLCIIRTSKEDFSLEVLLGFPIWALTSVVLAVWVTMSSDIIVPIILVGIVKFSLFLLISMDMGEEVHGSSKMFFGFLIQSLMLDALIIMARYLPIDPYVFLWGVTAIGLSVLPTLFLIKDEPVSIKAQTEIEKISELEQKALNQMRGVEFSFFPLAATILFMIIRQLMSQESNPLLVLEHDAAVVVRIIIILMIFILLLGIGAVYHHSLKNKLSLFWAEKKEIIFVH